MGSHPINLALRFLLEIAALLAIGYWGWGLYDTGLRYVFAFGLPIGFATIWGVFAVPNDPSRLGKAPKPVSGIVRLLLELGFFTFASWSLYDAGNTKFAWAFGIIVAVHYLISYDRIAWMLKH